LTATDELPELRFASGLPGFPDARRFVLVRIGDELSPFSVLRSLDGGSDVEFVVTHPGLFFPDYAPEIDDDTADGLELKSGDDALRPRHRDGDRPNRRLHGQPARPDRREPAHPGRRTGRARRIGLQHPRSARSLTDRLRSSVLVLTRRANQSIMIGADIVVTVLEVRGDQVRIGIDAPRSVSVHREEIFRELEAANRAAASPGSGALEGLAALRPPQERRSR
jgi:carbon storage regulator